MLKYRHFLCVGMSMHIHSFLFKVTHYSVHWDLLNEEWNGFILDPFPILLPSYVEIHSGWKTHDVLDIITKCHLWKVVLLYIFKTNVKHTIGPETKMYSVHIFTIALIWEKDITHWVTPLSTVHWSEITETSKTTVFNSYWTALVTPKDMATRINPELLMESWA